MMLLSASRVNYIASLSVKAMKVSQNQCLFYPTKLLKHSRPSYLGKPLCFKSYTPASRLCVIAALLEYLNRRKALTTESQLFVSFVKPHKPVHKDTVARWLKNVLLWSGIDTSIFTAHSYRSASTCKANSSNIPITDILKQGQWTTEKTWMTYYHKPQHSCNTSYAEGILHQ